MAMSDEAIHPRLSDSDSEVNDGRGISSMAPSFYQAFNQLHQRKTMTPMSWNGKLL